MGQVSVVSIDEAYDDVGKVEALIPPNYTL